MNGGLSQQVRVLQSTFRPYVSDETFEALEQADGFTQQEFCEWFDETHEDLANEQYGP